MISNIKDHLLMNSIEDLLLINSLDAAALMEHYRLFFMGLLPFVFMVALIFEYFAQIDPEGLLKRAVISVLLLSCVGTFYHKSINASIAAADEIFKSEKARNPTLREAFTRAVLPSEVVEKAGKGGYFSAVVDFVKFHLITSKINVVLKAVITLIVVICFIILKVVYSLVYWLGFALFAIPCLIYLLPGMSKVLKGALISYLWCLTLPHVLVVVMSMLTRLIGHSHTSGRIIGDSVLGTALIFVMALMVAFVPVITSFILTGGGVSHAGGVIAAMGANFAMNMPKQAFNRASRYLLVNAGGPMGLARKLFKSERSKEKNHVSTTPKGGKNHVSKTNQGKNHEQKKSIQAKTTLKPRKKPQLQRSGGGLSKPSPGHGGNQKAPGHHRRRRHHPANIRPDRGTRTNRARRRRRV